MINVVSLADTYLHAPLISYELLECLQGAHVRGKRVGLLYNRRGSGRAWICQDCGYYPHCPYCDIAFAYHTTPTHRLLCHQCNHILPVTHECLKCHGHRFEAIGIGIQKFAEDIVKLMPEVRMLRLDSDVGDTHRVLYEKVRDTDIVIGTHTSIGMLKGIDTIVFVLFESDLTVPDYRMEEDLYHAVHYAKKISQNVMIQTRLPEHPLLRQVLEGNYNDFLQYMSHERALFHYPPYTEFVILRIHDAQKNRVQDTISRLVNKIQIIKDDSIFLAYDQDIWERRASEYIQKIVLKGQNLSQILLQLQVEILKNKNVTLEWR